LPPSSGRMKPKPFVALNRLTVPVVILASPRCANARCPHDPRASLIRFQRCLGSRAGSARSTRQTIIRMGGAIMPEIASDNPIRATCPGT
jgi:hypothetical protein